MGITQRVSCCSPKDYHFRPRERWAAKKFMSCMKRRNQRKREKMTANMQRKKKKSSNIKEDPGALMPMAASEPIKGTPAAASSQPQDPILSAPFLNLNDPNVTPDQK
eukprot:180481_1